MSKILQDQGQVSRQFPMPTDDTSMSSTVKTAPSETVVLLYSNAGTRTTDAGQAAGTAVQGRLVFKNVLDVSGIAIGSFNDTSLAYTGAQFTEQIKFPVEVAETYKDATWAKKLEKITEGFTNGQFCLNHRTGEIWGVKATTAHELTSVTYLLNQGQTGSSGGLDSDVNIDQIAGVEVPADGGTFTPGTTGVIGAGFIYDDDATLTDGQIGAARVTEDRKQIGAAYDSSTASDKAFEVAPLNSSYVNESLVDTTNVTAATHYYPSSTGGVMDTWKDLSATGKFIDADGTLTLTLEVTNDEDTAGDWNAIKFFDSDSGVGSLVANLTVTNGTLLLTANAPDLNYRRYRWVVVANGATNTVELFNRKKAL